MSSYLPKTMAKNRDSHNSVAPTGRHSVAVENDFSPGSVAPEASPSLPQDVNRARWLLASKIAAAPSGENSSARGEIIALGSIGGESYLGSGILLREIINSSYQT